MNATAKLKISSLVAALILGILGDTLLRSFPWGLNFAVWAGLLGVTICFLRGTAEPPLITQGVGRLLIPIMLAPLAFLWHQSPALKALNLLALLTALSLAMLRVRGGRLHTSSLMQYAWGATVAGFNAALGMFPLLLKDRQWTSAFGGSRLRTTVAVLLGLALALPPLLVFGGLFMGADAVFHSLVVRFLGAVPSHALLIAFVTYIVGGYLRGLFFPKEMNLGTQKFLLPFSLGSIETGVMISLLDLLFLAFVAVQVHYFFGGSALVQATTGLTYAEYARRGFFELVAAASLVLPFLLFIHWLLRPDDAPTQRLFRWLAGAQIALLFVVMASAFERMRLYQAEYGMSEQRLYPTAFMGWLGVVSVWFCLTVLRGRRDRFAFGAMVAGFLLIAILHLVNPDALIARTNLERARTGRIFDARYAARLSADSVPELVVGLSALNPQDRCTLAKDLLERWSAPANPDWRSWSYSRRQAIRAIEQNSLTLRAACGATTP